LYGLIFLVPNVTLGYYFLLPFVEWQLEAAVREAFDVAYDNIYAFHLAQKSTEKSVENMKVCQFY
jgi:hypothetical protein